MTLRMVAALPIYALGYGVLFVCGLVALAGGGLLTLAQYVELHERSRRPRRSEL